MRRVTATDAARRFSELLDAVERDDETFVVDRKGRAVARITREPVASGAAAKDLLARLAPDVGWVDELAQLRASLPSQERNWPG
jgi:prevent-host-death family protein